MKILILKNYKKVAEKVASIIIDQINIKQNTNLGLATGKTMIPIYKKLSNLCKKKKIDFSRIKTFNIDEYINVPVIDKNSYHSYMHKLFFKYINIEPENIHFPPIIKPYGYDELIGRSGGIDIMVLGIGKNGHVAFNEPGSSIKSKTRIVKLSDSTIKSNSYFFKDGKVPKKAVSIGISTILKSKLIILVATGRNKADIVANTINSEVSSKIPASFLKKHKNTIFILDKDAASKIKSICLLL